MLEAILVGIIDAFLLRKTMQFCSGVDSRDSLSRGSVIESKTVSVFWILNSDSLCFLASVRTSAYACSSTVNVPITLLSIYTQYIDLKSLMVGSLCLTVR